jgi:quinol monooxygenase YgiN
MLTGRQAWRKEPIPSTLATAWASDTIRSMPTPEAQAELRIVAEIIAQPGKVAELRKALLGMIAPSNAESGCRQYELHADVENPNRLVFIERWKDQDAFDFHTRTSHFKNLGPAIAGFLAQPPKLSKLTIIG